MRDIRRGAGVKSFFKALLLAPLALIVILLAIANRAPVVVSFDPFSREAPALSATLPIYVVLFGAVMLGVAIGGVAAWLVQGKHRRAERGYRREAQRLNAETERLKNALASRQHALPPGQRAA